MKRFISKIIIALTFVLSLQFISYLYGNVDRVIAAINMGYPPHEFFIDGEVRGFDVDILSACAREMGVEIEWKPMVWEKALEALKKGEIGALCMSLEEKRKIYFTFTTQTLLECQLVIFVREDTYGIANIRDLANHTVAVENKDVAHMKLIELCPTSIRIPVENQEEAIKLLVRGDAYAVFGNEYTGRYLIHKNDYKHIKIIGEKIPSPSRVIAVKKGNFKLRDKFDAALLKIKISGEYQKIYDKWYGKQISTPRWLNYVFPIFSILLGVVGLLIIWSIFLSGIVKKRNMALIKSESHIRSILQAAEEEAFITTDLNNIITSFSPGAEKMFGYKEEEIVRNPISILHKPEQVERFSKITEQIKREKLSVKFEMVLLKKNGEEFPVEHIHYPIIDKNENVVSILSITRDITAKKEMEDKLKEDEERLRTLINYSLVGIYVIDINGTLLFVNKIFADMINDKVDNIIGRDVLQLIHSEDVEMVRERYKKRFTGEDSLPRYELRFIRRDGSTGWGEIHSHLVTYEGKPAIFGNIVDITERKSIEAQLRHSQKMESIGTLAGGIAHDFNNILTGILGNVSMLLFDAPQDHPFYIRLKEVEKASERAAELTRQLLGFSRKSMIMPKPTNLNSCVEDTVKLFKHTIDPKIIVETQLYPGLGIANVDKSQISQILMNLLINAKDAIEEQIEKETIEPSLSFIKPDQHKIIVETHNTIINEEYCGTHPETQKGEFVQISVTDTGCGIDNKTIDRIFDPFFTTKSVDKGTGLGLAMVYGIVKQHSGWVNVYSNVGRGSTFKIYIPRISEEKEEEQITPQEVIVKGGNETVLLIDDEEIIRNLGNAILGKYGYKVILSEDGEEAINIYKREWESKADAKNFIDLVIVDLSMPKMGGPEVIDELMKINPQQKIILSSGYSVNGVARKLLNKGVRGFVQKPYHSIQFAKIVREILDQ